jgi:hypothetical protein
MIGTSPAIERSAYFPGALPSVLSFEYLSTISMCQMRAHAKLRSAKGEGDEEDDDLVSGCEATFARNGTDPRDYGFEDVLTFDSKLVRAGTGWGCA